MSSCGRGSKDRISIPVRAERKVMVYIERPVIFAISLREIAKMTGLSREYGVV
jgi:hypothetical protein